MDIWDRIAKLEAMMAANRRQARYAETISRTEAEVAATKAEWEEDREEAAAFYHYECPSCAFGAVKPVGNHECPRCWRAMEMKGRAR